MFKHILVATDGSKLSLRALDLALGVAEAHTAKLTVVMVVAPFPPVYMYSGDGYMLSPLTAADWEAGTEAQKKAITADIAKCAAKWNKNRTSGLAATPKFVAVESSSVYEGILATAKKQKCDLLVMASHGRRGLSALLLGSETTKVLTHSKLPVLICK